MTQWKYFLWLKLYTRFQCFWHCFWELITREEDKGFTSFQRALALDGFVMTLQEEEWWVFFVRVWLCVCLFLYKSLEHWYMKTGRKCEVQNITTYPFCIWVKWSLFVGRIKLAKDCQTDLWVVWIPQTTLKWSFNFF